MRKDKSSPLVTVVVPTFQHERFLRQCLDGVIMQVIDFDMQVMVIDDASADSTPDIIKEYACKYPDKIEAILLTENMFKSGRKYQDVIRPKVKGKYLAICEGDDYWTEPYKLQRQVDFLEAHPDYSACFHLVGIKNEAGVENPYIPRMKHDRDVTPRETILEHLAHTHSLLFRTRCFRTSDEYWHLYYEMYPVTDILLFADVHAMGKVHGFAEKWSVYRLHRGGIYTQKVLKDSEKNKVYLHESKLIKAYYPPTHPMHSWLKLYEALVGWTMLRRNGHTGKAIMHLIKTFARRPRKFLSLYVNRYLR